MKSYKLFYRLLLIVFFLIFLPIRSFAADFKTDYKAEYFPQESSEGIDTKVKFTITITNLQSDVYVKKITLSFPNEFAVDDVYVLDNNARLTPQIVTKELYTEMQLEFSDPRIGRDNVNTFYLEFNQKNIVQASGNLWEVMLPTLNKETRNSYQVILHLPQISSKKISIAKPKPDEIIGDQIIWNNPETKTIYAVLGSYQYYQLKLNYHLDNPKIVPVYTDIALPPDTLYQKIYLNSLKPLPSQIFIDDDGNLLARYILKPKEKNDIIYDGLLEVYTSPREEVLNNVRLNINKQKKYLYRSDKNWSLDETQIINNPKNIKDIYFFVVNSLSYDYHRLSSNNTRLGASQALKNKNKAVCVEFTDVFIALARERGIMSREIQGYGYSQNNKFRPLSLSSDILHSWPEYYDEKLGIWVPVDPTWENTSGIDYYSSFDFNHIVFAIHGKKSDYPLPAGMYKFDNSQDIIIKPVINKPEDRIEIKINSINIDNNLFNNKKYQGKLTVENNSNVYLWNIPIEYLSKNIVLENNKETIDVLAPYQKKEIIFNFQPKNLKVKSAGQLIINIYGNTLYNKLFNIFPYYYQIAYLISLVIISLTIIIFLKKILTRHGN